VLDLLDRRMLQRHQPRDALLHRLQ
jgi:hypothetical protein